jgi:hypothetical protein
MRCIFCRFEHQNSKLYKMKKISFCLLSLVVGVVCSCGEAGIQSDISQIVDVDPISVSIDIPPLLIGQTIDVTPPTTVNTGAINITSDEFAEYSDELQRFTINQIYYTLSGIDAGNEADLDIDMNIILNGGSSIPMLSTVIVDAQTQTAQVLLYDKANSGSVNAVAISGIESALLNGTSFVLEMNIVGRNVRFQSSSDQFQFQFKFDVTARVQLD